MEQNQGLKYRQKQFLQNETKCYIYLSLITISVLLLFANIVISFDNNLFRSMLSTQINL